jgi:hypothetical protein
MNPRTLLAACFCAPSLLFGAFTIPPQNQDELFILNAPADVSEDSSLISDDNAWILTEQTGVAIDEQDGVAVDVLNPTSTYGTNSEDPVTGDQVNRIKPGILPTGVYDSYLIYAQSSSSETTFFSSFLEFSTPIIGLAFLNPNLADTSSVFGLANVKYLPAGPFDTPKNKRDLVITAGGTKLEYSFQNTGDVDSVRIITVSAIPEPAHIVGLGVLGLIALATLRRRIRR